MLFLVAQAPFFRKLHISTLSTPRLNIDYTAHTEHFHTDLNLRDCAATVTKICSTL
jgi:hypothetical protein